MSEPTFQAVYLSGQFNPCPCGHYFNLNDMEGLKKHYTDGHFNYEFTAEAETNGGGHV